MSYMKGISALVGDEENATEFENANETSEVLPVLDANIKSQKAAKSLKAV